MMIRSTGGLPESSTTFNKPNCDRDGQRNTVNSLNNVVVVVTVPSVNLTNPSTSVIVVSQSTTTMSSSNRNSRNNFNYKCSCKELASHSSHRSNHYSSGVHSSHFQHHGNHHHHHHHYNHPGHKENHTSHSVVESSNSSPTSGTSSSHHYSSHYSTSHQTVPTFQHNIKHNSFPIKWKPAISRHLQEFMISQWEQFHARLLHSNNIVTKSCCTGATTINTDTLTTVAINNQLTTSGDSTTNNNDSPSSSNDMTSSRTSLSDNSSSGQIANTQSNNNGSNSNSGNDSPSIIDSNIIGRSSGSRVNDLPVTLATITTTISNTTHGRGSNNVSSNTYGVAMSSCNSYPRRKQSCGYVTNQMGKGMNTGSLGWKRNQTSGRKISPGNFNNRYPVNYFSNRNSSFIISTTPTTATSNSVLPVVTYISSSITTTTITTTTATTPTVVNSSNTDQMSITTVTINNQSNLQSSNVIDFKTNTSVPLLLSSSSEGCIQQKVSSSLPESNSIFKIDIYNSSTVTNSIINSQKLEIKTEDVDKVSDMKIHVNNNCVVIAQKHLSDLHLTSGDNNNTIDKLKEDIPIDESTKNSCITLSNSSLLLLPEEERTLTIASILKVDQEIGSSISCGKVEEGECYWTPDPPASPENNTTPHHENYSSSYHSTSVSPSPPQLSVSLPCSKDLHTTAYHPPLSIRTELSSMLDFRRFNQPRDSPHISSSNNSRLESLNDVD
ncbi:unnamed protein product [Schistosoma rodhaini]|uniref:Uncharacterized protein n=1 Tax=Schistosoma rodhaini TaxID=6188 RepID=A0AA85GAI1_9TREM|nr:unnamed protein product [Schistosoma rodhaini]